MQFNNTTTRIGIIQEIERITQLGVAGVSGNANLLLDFTARVNQALDRYCYLPLMADGNWQIDDTGNTDFPIGVTNLVSGQQDYSFDSDVLTVEKVLVKNSAGTWGEIFPVDVQENNAFARNTWELPSNNSGTPYTYDKFANSLLLNPIPNYNSTNGLKVVFTRNFIQFASTDTTATPGIPSIFHNYLCISAAYPFCRDARKDNRADLLAEIARTEDAIKEFYSKRTKDEKTKLTLVRRSSR